MKKILILLFVSSCFCIYAQSVKQDSLYMVTYSLGASWDKNKSPQEQSFFKEHSGHLSKLRKEGVIKLGARYVDKGMIFVSAKDMATAKELITADPAILNQLFVADIQKLNLFYEGCAEKPK